MPHCLEVLIDDCCNPGFYSSCEIPISLAEVDQLTLESLERKICDRNQQLFFWSENKEENALIGNDDELREAIYAQVRRQQRLRLFVSLQRKRRLSSASQEGNEEKMTKIDCGEDVSPSQSIAKATEPRSPVFLLRDAVAAVEDISGYERDEWFPDGKVEQVACLNKKDIHEMIGKHKGIYISFKNRQSSKHCLPKRQEEVIVTTVRRLCAEARKKLISPLHLACEEGDIEGGLAFLQCTYEMVTNESEDVKQYLRPNVINPRLLSREFFPPLHVAARLGRTELVSLLIAFKANIEEPGGSKKQTPLHIAAECANVETVFLLLAVGANIEALDENNETPLHYAATNEHSAVMSLLCEEGANIEAKDRGTKYTGAFDYSEMDNRTPIFMALSKRRTDTASFLIAQRANVEALDMNLWSPLHVAAGMGHTEIVPRLIAQGANTKAMNDNGHTPRLHAINVKIDLEIYFSVI